MADEKQYGLLFRFDDKSKSFTHGFEAGAIAEEMSRGEMVISGMVHTANRGLILRMAEHYGYSVDTTETNYEEWMEMEAHNQEPEPPEN